MFYIRKNMRIKEYLNKHKGFIISFLFNIFLCICLMFNCKGSEPKTVVEYVPVHDTVTVTKERIIEKTSVQKIILLHVRHPPKVPQSGMYPYPRAI